MSPIPGNLHLSATVKNQGQRWAILDLGKGCVAIIDAQEFIEAVRRGKAFRRAKGALEVND